jgi:hypothetical protein
MMNKKTETEVRLTGSEVRIGSGNKNEPSRKVEGYALLFNTPSDALDFEEVILPGALDGVIEKSNVFALLNHDPGRGILARCKSGKGTLKLEINSKGLLYSFDAPKTALGDELLEYLKRGEVSESSFAFTVAEDVWEKVGTKTRRTIKKFDELFDVSPVYDAAYSKTTVSARAKDRKAKAEELADYYAELNKWIDQN